MKEKTNMATSGNHAANLLKHHLGPHPITPALRIRVGLDLQDLGEEAA